MKYLFIFGDLDGYRIAVDPSIIYCQPEGTTHFYIKLASKGDGEFFMLCGTVPLDALLRFRELLAK